ncbi:MAG: translational machinery protein [Roseiarcus sp.]|jgi:stalled ribosome rescue protein Dom34
MSHHSHAVVWIDHREARVFHFNATEDDEQDVHPRDPTAHIHHHANEIGSGHAAEDQKYLHEVAAAIADVKAALITGPANAKNELMKHIQRHDPRIAAIVAGVEALDHPTNGELIAHARRFFRAADRMSPQKA